MGHHPKIPCQCGKPMNITAKRCWACHASKPKARAPKKCPLCPAMIGGQATTCKKCVVRQKRLTDDTDDAETITDAELDAIIAEQLPTMKSDSGGKYGYSPTTAPRIIQRTVRCDRRWKGWGVIISGGRL